MRRRASITLEEQYISPIANRIIRKRKRNVAASNAVTAKTMRQSEWHENDDEDSSSNDTTPLPALSTRQQPKRTELPVARNQLSGGKQANNTSILLNASININGLDSSILESPKPVYSLTPSMVNGTVLHDLKRKPWRLGRPIGKGNFGEIFLASDNVSIPVTNENAKYVVKIEPHSNGPLFVEIHCLMNTANKSVANKEEDTETHQKTTLLNGANIPQNPPSGIPEYIASGSHYFGNARYRYLVLQRFDRDLHSLIKNCRVSQKSVLILAIQIINVLENLHDKGYCHNDVKAQNLMISRYKYYKSEELSNNMTNGKVSMNTKVKYEENYDEKQQTTDSGNSSEQDLNDDDDSNFVMKRHGRNYKKEEEEDFDEDEDFDDGSTSNSINSNSMDTYTTPTNRNRRRRVRTSVEFSGSNPVRSCRRQQTTNGIYDEMVKSHYLRPTKRISYIEFFNDDTSMPVENSKHFESNGAASSDNESDEFLPHAQRRSQSAKKSAVSTCTSSHRLTRRQEKLLSNANDKNKSSDDHISNQTHSQKKILVEEERIFLIDYGLASKFLESGVHRPFVMDQRRAHDGTLEFTSRDAHMGAHSRRSDLECLGYNLIYWSQGYLPWKEAASQQQQEKVHRAKEYLMTDVREMLKQIYGKQVPKYLGDFLHYVGQLSYHERPDYGCYRRIFQAEFQRLGYSVAKHMQINSNEISSTCVRFKEELENKIDILELNKYNNNVMNMMKNVSVGTPFQERTNRVSPKNLRSKSDKKSLKKKKFCWAEVLSQDPDQIARERAEKEFDREECLSEVRPARKYEGNPTYAILAVLARLKAAGRSVEGFGKNSDNENEMSEDPQDDENIEENETDEEEEEEEESDEHEENDKETASESNDDDESTEEDNDDDDDEEESDEDDSSENLSDHVSTTRRTEVTKRGKSSTKTQKLIDIKNSKPNGSQRVLSKTSSSTTRTRSSRSNMESVKRSCTTRCGRKATVVTQRRYSVSRSNERSNGNTKNPERRTRRCLIKTDLMDFDTEESNSNFGSDVNGGYGTWRKML